MSKFVRRIVVLAGAAGLLVTGATGYAANARTPSAAQSAASGPVDLSLRAAYSPASSTTVTVGSFTYQATFTNSGFYYTTALVVTGRNGVTGRISGDYREGDHSGVPTNEHSFDTAIAPSASFTNTVFDNTDAIRTADALTVMGSDGTRQSVRVSLTTDIRSAKTSPYQGVVTASVTPAG